MSQWKFLRDSNVLNPNHGSDTSLKGTLRSLSGRRSDTVISTINEVLAKLLTVGITDQDPDVRSVVMDCLDDCFDYHLAQAENLSALFVAMNDEVFEIRDSDNLGWPDPVWWVTPNLMPSKFLASHSSTVGLTGCMVTHRERFNTENREIEEIQGKALALKPRFCVFITELLLYPPVSTWVGENLAEWA